MDLKNTGKAFMSIHDAFFSLDKSKKLARIDLEFPAPSAIFSSTVHAGIPMLNEDFLAQLYHAFDLIPDRYKLDINVFSVTRKATAQSAWRKSSGKT